MEPLKLVIDWEGYFENFCEVHGPDPITDPSRNYLLFQDGWRYHSTRPSGPEFPPDDESHAVALKKQYWTLRIGKAERELEYLKARISTLRNLQDSLSATIPVHTTIYDEGLGREVHVSRPVDFDLLEARVTWLERDLQDAAFKIKELSKERSDAPQISA